MENFQWKCFLEAFIKGRLLRRNKKLNFMSHNSKEFDLLSSLISKLKEFFCFLKAY